MKRSYWVAMTLLVQVAAAAQAAPMTSADVATQVMNRLAFGPRPGDIARVEAMGVDQYIEAQLDPETIPLPEALARKLAAIDTDHDSAGHTLAAFLNARDSTRQGHPEEGKEIIARIVAQTGEARLLRALESPRQLQEVMVDFWFNHFNVFAGKGLDRALVNAYERDAIRPHALGRFRALLGATAKDPAMLFYLDNWLSSAAESPAGAARRARAGQKAKASGLNENYAREVMELHTLGVDGGYTQADVTELARMLTGWSFAPRVLARDDIGFRFDAARHDSAAKEWLGRRITAEGQNEGDPRVARVRVKYAVF